MTSYGADHVMAMGAIRALDLGNHLCGHVKILEAAARPICRRAYELRGRQTSPNAVALNYWWRT